MCCHVCLVVVAEERSSQPCCNQSTQHVCVLSCLSGVCLRVLSCLSVWPTLQAQLGELVMGSSRFAVRLDWSPAQESQVGGGVETLWVNGWVRGLGVGSHTEVSCLMQHL